MMALLLAQNEALKEALMNLDEEKGYKILSQSLKILQKYIKIPGIKAQVIAKDDLTIFARSWDKDFVGMPLEGFRKDLSSFKTSKPKVSIETGRLLSIKATAPIKQGYKTIGFMEIISLFGPLTKELRRHGIEMLVLMDQKFLDVATLMRENPMVHGYVVSNRYYSAPLLDRIEKIDLKKLSKLGHIYDGKYLYIYQPMYNSAGDYLGLFLLALDNGTIEKFKKSQENPLFFMTFDSKEFADIIDLWEHPEGSFRSVYDRSVAEFLSKNEDEELKRSFEEELKELLRGYSKEELINIIIEKYKRQKKRGAIR